MVKSLVLLGACLALCACAQPSVVQAGAHYPTYREYLAVFVTDAVDKGPYSSAPGPVKLAYGECSAALAVSSMTPGQIEKLDAFARGERSFTPEEWKAINADVASRQPAPVTYATLDRLSQLCPEDVPLFKRYFGPGFNGL